MSADEALLELRLRDAGTGRPIAGATVELGTTPLDAELETIRLATTDTNGTLRVHVTPGLQRAVAWKDRLVSAPQFVELVASEEHVLELALELAHEVAGRVIDAETGAPVAGAEVAFWTFAERDVVRTARDGSFRHARFPVGELAEQVRAHAPGYGSSVRYLRIGADGRWELPHPLDSTADRAGTGVPFVEIALVPELRVRGRVVDSAGDPVAGASVQAEGYVQVLPSVAAADGARSTTAADGSFELGGLRSDVGHGLLVEAEGCAETSRELAAARGLLELEPIRLERSRILAGAVVDAEGFPVEDVRVVVEPLDPDEHWEAGQRETAAPASLQDVAARVLATEHETRTTREGIFVLDGLRPGDYRVYVTRDAAPLLESTLARDEPMRFLELRLPADSVTLRGRVEGAAPGGATLEIDRFGTVARVRTDADGRFRVAGLDTDAAYELTVSAGGRLPARAFAEVYAHEEPILILEPLAAEETARLAADGDE